MLFQSSSPLLQKRNAEVSSKGELVILRIGNVDIPMHYEHALDISRWIRSEAKSAKSLSGRGKTVRSLGLMEDLAAKAVPLPRQPGVAIHVKQRLQTWHREDVWTVGKIVHVKIGSNTLTFHFETALKVAQWIRVRAKEARNRAGDVRHWSAIGTLEDLK
jgi:hypothetical protein